RELVRAPGCRLRRVGAAARDLHATETRQEQGPLLRPLRELDQGAARGLADAHGRQEVPELRRGRRQSGAGGLQPVTSIGTYVREGELFNDPACVVAEAEFAGR